MATCVKQIWACEEVKACASLQGQHGLSCITSATHGCLNSNAILTLLLFPLCSLPFFCLWSTPM